MNQADSGISSLISDIDKMIASTKKYPQSKTLKENN